jgi:hypothetical protein
MLTQYCVVPHVGQYYGTLPPETKHLTVTNLSHVDLQVFADGRPIFTVSPRATSSRVKAKGYTQLHATAPFLLVTDADRPAGPSI